MPFSFFSQNVNLKRACISRTRHPSADPPSNRQLAVAVIGCTRKDAIDHEVAPGLLAALREPVASFRIMGWRQRGATR